MALVECTETVDRVEVVHRVGRPEARLRLAVDGATVYVRKPDGTEQPIYSKKNTDPDSAAVLLTQPIKSVNGRIECWYDPGLHLDLHVSKPGEIQSYVQRIVTGGNPPDITAHDADPLAHPVARKWFPQPTGGDDGPELMSRLNAGEREIQFRDGTYVYPSQLGLSLMKGRILRGVGGPTKSGGSGTVMVFTGSGAGSFIDATQTEGLLFEDLAILHNNNAFTGNLIDIRGSATGLVTNHIVFRRAFLGAQPTTMTTAASLVRMDRSVLVTFEEGGSRGGARQFIGHDGTSFANAVLFKRWLFEGGGAAPILNPGEGWTFETEAGEPLATNTVGLVECEPGVQASGMEVSGGWFGDPSVAGGVWFKWAGMGFSVHGARMGADDAGGTILQLTSNGCQGIDLSGNKFKTCTVLDFAGTTGHKNIRHPLDSNGFENATLFAGTPSGLRDSSGEYVTALPASGVHGQVIDLAVDAANGVIWKLRYNALSASAYKWEFIGGPPLFAEVAATEGTASTTYAALTTAGPSITLPLGGDYMVSTGARVSNTTAGAYSMMSYDIGATAAVDADRLALKAAAAGAGDDSVTRQRRKQAMTAVTLAAKYRATAGTAEFGERWMSVVPVRLG